MAILSKLGLDYLVFFFTFHATKLTAQAWKIPKLAEFMESLTHEQDKLVMMMGTIKPSKDQYLVARDSRVDSKRKKKAKNPPEKKERQVKVSRGASKLQEEILEEEE